MAGHFQDEVGSDRSEEAIISRCSGDHFNMIHGSFLLVARSFSGRKSDHFRKASPAFRSDDQIALI
jgi:hypothetical protein